MIVMDSEAKIAQISLLGLHSAYIKPTRFLLYLESPGHLQHCGVQVAAVL